ncbi:MAG TPA: hypothetical protein VJL07_02750 [Dehalococcoidia bacterium]|nr:hypothetical protein [Dehalococcoidia bacterium]
MTEEAERRRAYYERLDATVQRAIKAAAAGKTVERRKDHLSRAKFQELRASIWSRHDLSQGQKERIDEELRIHFGGGMNNKMLRDIIQEILESNS